MFTLTIVECLQPGRCAEPIAPALLVSRQNSRRFITDNLPGQRDFQSSSTFSQRETHACRWTTTSRTTPIATQHRGISPSPLDLSMWISVRKYGGHAALYYVTQFCSLLCIYARSPYMLLQVLLTRYCRVIESVKSWQSAMSNNVRSC
jgi:hypothetical protein